MNINGWNNNNDNSICNNDTMIIGLIMIIKMRPLKFGFRF